MDPDTSTGLPLRGLPILDLTEGAAQSCGRYLADLGAQVILVEPPGGSAGTVAAAALWTPSRTGSVMSRTRGIWPAGSTRHPSSVRSPTSSRRCAACR